MVQMKGADSNRLGAAVAAGILLSAAGSAPVPAAFADEAPAIVKETTAGGQWRYSEFINQVNGDNVEKVTFSSDGQQLLAIDTDGGRHKLEAIPNDPELLNTLTSHKVDVTVLPQEANAGGPALDFLQSLIFPTVLLGGLFFLSRGAGGGMGGMGGMGGGAEPEAPDEGPKIEEID